MFLFFIMVCIYPFFFRSEIVELLTLNWYFQGAQIISKRGNGSELSYGFESVHADSLARSLKSKIS